MCFQASLCFCWLTEVRTLVYTGAPAPPDVWPGRLVGRIPQPASRFSLPAPPAGRALLAGSSPPCSPLAAPPTPAAMAIQ